MIHNAAAQSNEFLRQLLHELAEATSPPRTISPEHFRELESWCAVWRNPASATPDLVARPGPANAAQYHLHKLCDCLKRDARCRAQFHARWLLHLAAPEDVAHLPLVSIVIPLYNRPHLAAATVRSCLEQTYPRIEVIVIDDGSTEPPDPHLAPYLGRIRLVRQSNQGVSAARNHGLHLACGDLVHFLDADDRLAPDCIAAQMAALREVADADVCMSLHACAGENGLSNAISDKAICLGDEHCPTIDLLRTTVWRFPMSVTSLLAPRWVWLQIGFFDEDLRQAEDVRYLFRMAMAGVKVIGLQRELTIMHLGPGSLTTATEENRRFGGHAYLRNLCDLLGTPSAWRHVETFLCRYWGDALQATLRGDEIARRWRRQLNQRIHELPHIAKRHSVALPPLLQAIAAACRVRADVAELLADTHAFRRRLLAPAEAAQSNSRTGFHKRLFSAIRSMFVMSKR